MDRIAKAFENARQQNRACFVAYLCAGDPDFQTSLDCCRALVDAGTDIIEIGVPFSDPLADGLTNQLAAQRALESGMTTDRVFALAAELRKHTDVPIVFYTYYNLVFANGVRNYVQRVRDAGVDGLLTLDLPPEEAGELLGHSRDLQVSNIFIVAPTTPEKRIRKIAAVASGFIYYVSREGVTGERDSLPRNIGETVARIRGASSLPVVVGFGISNREQAHAVAGLADGVVVGSALVKCIRDNLGRPEAAVAALTARAADLVGGMQR
ncbi:MAG TPA: tryptophan synthase subunit alpha [Opitutaceae bacterium]